MNKLIIITLLLTTQVYVYSAQQNTIESTDISPNSAQPKTPTTFLRTFNFVELQKQQAVAAEKDSAKKKLQVNTQQVNTQNVRQKSMESSNIEVETDICDDCGCIVQ